MSLSLHLRLPEPRWGGDGHWSHKKPRISPPSPSFSSHVRSIIRGCQVYLLTSTEPENFSPPAPMAIAQGQATTLSALDNYRRPPSRLPGAIWFSSSFSMCQPEELLTTQI